MRRMVLLVDRLLHPESSNKLHSRTIAHAEDAPACRLNCAYVSAGIALRVCGDVSQSGAWRLQGQAAHGGIESVIGKRAGQRDMRGGAVHDHGADARRIPSGLINAACNRGGGQQGRFETDPCRSGGSAFALGSGGINNLKTAGKCSLYWKGEVHIDEGSCTGSNWSHVDAVGVVLRIGAELQDESGVVCRHIGLHVARAIIGRCVESDIALGHGISAHVEEPGRQERI